MKWSYIMNIPSILRNLLLQVCFMYVYSLYLIKMFYFLFWISLVHKRVIVHYASFASKDIHFKHCAQTTAVHPWSLWLIHSTKITFEIESFTFGKVVHGIFKCNRKFMFDRMWRFGYFFIAISKKLRKYPLRRTPSS